MFLFIQRQIKENTQKEEFKEFIDFVFFLSS